MSITGKVASHGLASYCKQNFKIPKRPKLDCEMRTTRIGGGTAMKDFRIPIATFVILAFAVFSASAQMWRIDSVRSLPSDYLKLRSLDKKQKIESLSKVNGKFFNFRIHFDGTLRYLGGSNLVPNLGLAQIRTRDSSDNILRAILVDLQDLFERDGEKPCSSSVRLTRFVPSRDSSYHIVAEQYVDSIPVRYGELKISISSGKVGEIHGRLFTPSQLKLRGSLSQLLKRDSLRILLEMETRDRYEFRKRYFDPWRGTIISEFLSLETNGKCIVVDEFSHKILATKDVSDYHNWIPKKTKRIRYKNG